jgi:hypothetical protein
MAPPINGLESFAPISDGAAEYIEQTAPYTARVRVTGVAPLLCHAWNVESVDEKAKAKKGSKAKKTDDVESYVYRDERGFICIPTEYFHMALVGAARYRQDPRSPRKSAMDLFKAGLAGLEELCSLGTKEWDYLDRHRVTVQRSSITRVRPAFKPGWTVDVALTVLLPEYISPEMLNDSFTQAGKLIGVGDHRPTYGRFQIVGFVTSAA